MKKFTILIIFGLMLCMSRCGYLDETPYAWHNPKDVFSGEDFYTRPVNQVYENIRGGYNRIGSSFLDAATDDATTTINGSAIHQLARGFATSSNAIDASWNGSYKGIREAIYAQDNLMKYDVVLTGKTPEETEALKLVYVGELHCLRALFEYDLLRYYAGFPIVDKVYELGDPEIKNKVRNSFSDCVDHIVALCDTAAIALDVNPITYGRMCKGMALAIKAKTLCYAASPLYNDPSNTNPLLGYTEVAGLQSRWEAAAAACADVINLKKDGTIGVGGTKAYTLNVVNTKAPYDKIFITMPNNEYIVFCTAGKSNGLENRHYPPSLSKNSGGGTVPTQELVDAFTMKNGEDYVRPEDGDPKYTERDPRFASIVGYDGMQYATAKRTIYTRVGEGSTMDALNFVTEKSTNTGYYLVKMMDKSLDFTKTNTGTVFHVFPIIRLADIILLYAEAMTNSYGIDIDPLGYGLTAVDAVKKIRSRAGFAGTDKFLDLVTTREQMMAKIKQERRIELCFEEQRYFDLCRWKDGDQLALDATGIQIEKIEGKLTYKYFTVDDKRKFDKHMYYHPIPLAELRRSPNIVQNPGW